MVSQTTEQTMESAIKKFLTGSYLEELKEVKDDDIPFSQNQGYQLGYPQDFKEQYAIDDKFLWKFLKITQEKELEKLKKSDSGWQRMVSVLSEAECRK